MITRRKALKAIGMGLTAIVVAPKLLADAVVTKKPKSHRELLQDGGGHLYRLTAREKPRQQKYRARWLEDEWAIYLGGRV